MSRRQSGGAGALFGPSVACERSLTATDGFKAAWLVTFSEVTAKFHASATPEQVLQELTCAACGMTGADEAVGSWTGSPRTVARRRPLSVAHQRGLPADASSPSEPTVYDAIAERAAGAVRLSRAEIETHPVWRQWPEESGSAASPLAGLLAAPLLGRDGQTVGFIRVTGSVLEEFSADDEALLGQLAIHAAVALENSGAAEQLQLADRRKDEFLATLAHEIRNPLTSIRTGLDLLASGEQVDQLIEPMENQFEQLQRVVDDLMDVPRLVRGKIQLRRQSVSVGEVVQRAVDAVRTHIDQHDHSLSVRVPDESLMLNADPVRIAQSIGNLLTNAAKYTDRGGCIWLEVRREGEHVAVSVRDNGIGIEPEMASSLFDLFQQAERTLDHSEGGLGIGLTLVKSLAEMHGGEVTMHSEGKNRGSEFVLRLPLDACSSDASGAGSGAPEDDSARASDGGEQPADRSSGLRILVVDDNRSATTMLARLIGKLGDHAVAVTHDGASAIASAQQEPPDLVVLDIGLPEMSGHDVARQLRRLPELQHALLVALTGYGDAGDRRESFESGFDLHLVKPIGIEELRQLLEHPKLVRS